MVKVVVSNGVSSVVYESDNFDMSDVLYVVGLSSVLFDDVQEAL